ncbi:MAG: ABC transporter ATP-binding protein [Chitinophagales bacterium]|nr:ABC transporter ATP-binding protein [Bacteroidota bacterium]MBP7400459.1 ABC transporter ATP-binding protein [Chitinophagales bacterium]MBK8488254.1 ABC transporter ATP-binding protein [Bacteroidota bacterium]MBK8681984.1 ABC transporter ATP-binding protein [Bacteroidota bacterium]MBP8753376.1 ABC transporter ATP-binding protein [Chitinophagales bacterium]
MKHEPVITDTNNVAISIENLHKSFGDLHILQGITIDIYKGENLVVLGRSGTGKSVLIKIIAGLLKPDKGKVVVLGNDISTLSEKELQQLRLKLGFSFQSSALYDSMTVKENLEFPLVRNNRKLAQSQIDESVNEALEAVGLIKAIHQMPSELSGGQRKRIGIARTLMLKPEVMLYDEPTAGLDPITCIEINNLINKVQQVYHTTSIIITHDLTCAKATGDRIAMLIDGRFLRRGTFDEIFSTEDETVKKFFDYNFIN